jgi:hypothetical protein
MPLVSKTFDQLLDFTRTTAGSFVGSNGLIQNTAASRNLMFQTQQFDNAFWGKVGGSVTANTTVAPDGTSTADTYAEDTASSMHYAQQSLSGISAGQTLTGSLYFKAGTRTYAVLSLYHTTSNNYAVASFNLSTGAVANTAVAGTGISITSTSITSVGDGWYRCTITAVAGGAAFLRFGWGASADGTVGGTLGFPTYLGTSDTLFLWGAQVELAATATTYTRNNGGVFPPRFDYDPVTLAPKGILIEEQRTNLLVYSEQFDNATWVKSTATVTADTTVSPDGTADADTLTSSSTSGVVERFVGFTGNGDKAVSIFLKAGTSTLTYLFIRDTTAAVTRGRALITWTGGVPSATADNGGTIQGVDNFGNGWYRIRLLTPGIVAANGHSFRIQPDAAVGTGTIIAWGAQAENGAFATSYIPTVASTVTRTVDNTSIVAPNFAPWYNQSAGTLVVSATGYNAPTVAQGGTSPTAASLYAAAAGNSFATIAISRRDSVSTPVLNSPTAYVISDSGVTGIDIQQSSVSWAGATVSAAFAWSGSTDAAFTANGAAVVTDSSYTLPTSDSLQIGRWGSENVTGYWSGHIRSIRYFPVRLSNAQLQALTA